MNSLRSRLLLLIGLALVPAVLVALFNSYNHRQLAVRAAEIALQQLTQLAATNQAQPLNTARQLLRDLSDAPGLLDGPARCGELMRATQQSNPEYVNLGLIQPNGDMNCSAIATPGAVNVADRAYFKAALLSKRFGVGGHVFGRVSQKHTIVLTHPVLDRSGAVLAVLFASIDANALDKFLGDLVLPAGAVLETVDRDGLIVSRRPDAHTWFGKPVSKELLAGFNDKVRTPRILLDADGVERLRAFADVGPPDVTQMVLSIGMPTAQIVAPAMREQLRTSVILALTSALALLVAWYTGQYLIVRRVDTLVATADNIAEGNYVARPDATYKKDELSRLDRAIDQMASSLLDQTSERDRAEALLQRANSELVKTSLQKDEFLAMLAHELRNPLAPIRNAAYLLRKMPAVDARVIKAGELIARQVDHMAKLVDDLLDVSRVTRGMVTMAMQPVDLNRIVDTAIEQMRPAVGARHHALRVGTHPSPAIVHGDAARLIQVVANLLSNACKYTPERGTISIDLKAAGESWEIRVADNGIGIDHELLSRVFDLFSQGERTPDRSEGGLGLGLHLAKGLVETHGGRITASSAGAGMGATFTVSLPAATGTDTTLANDAQVHTVPGALIASIGVMVVDDVIDIADTTGELLETMGYEVAVEYSGNGALERAAAVAPQICLLDIGMPEMDGYELVRRLRLLPQTRHSVMVAVTGYGTAGDRTRAMAAGFDHHLVKPVNPVALLELLGSNAA